MCRIIEEIMMNLRRMQEEEKRDEEEHKKCVMDAISSSVKDRITVIDLVVSQELSSPAVDQQIETESVAATQSQKL